MALGDRGAPVRTFVDDVAHAMFGVIALIVKAAPIGAFGAMAYTIGSYGPQALGNLAGLIATFYLTAGAFVFLVLGTIAWFAGFSIFKYPPLHQGRAPDRARHESSESALPQLMEKLERLGCSKPVVGLVVPTGYSFNLDGTNIYMTLATLFIAQALGVDAQLRRADDDPHRRHAHLEGRAGVTGAGFITLAGTLAAVRPELVPGMAIVLGIDKFMSECRALTNIIGNGVATIVVSAWEGELDRQRMAAALSADIDPSDVATAISTG